MKFRAHLDEGDKQRAYNYFDEMRNHIVGNITSSGHGTNIAPVFHIGTSNVTLKNLHQPLPHGVLDCRSVHTLTFNETCTNFDLRGIERWIPEIADDANMHWSDRTFGQIKFKASPGPKHLLHLFLIKGLNYVWFHADYASFPAPSLRTFAETIINKHLKNGRDGMIDCQHELIDAGYEHLI